MHTHSHTHARSGSPHGDSEETQGVIYLKGMARPGTSCSLVFSGGQSHIGKGEARRPVCHLSPPAAAAA